MMVTKLIHLKSVVYSLSVASLLCIGIRMWSVRTHTENAEAVAHRSNSLHVVELETRLFQSHTTLVSIKRKEHRATLTYGNLCTADFRHKSLLVLSNFSCEGIIYESERYKTNLQEAFSFMERTPIGKTADEYYIALVRDCQIFKNTLGYHIVPLPDEDLDFSIAFNLLIHNRVEQFERLLRAIYRPQNSYCIHVDAKSSDKFVMAVRGIAGCFHNVFVASKLESVVYAGYSRLQADINCMKDQLKSPINWRYLLNTAANAYPLKTNAEIVKILKTYNGANDIRGVSSPHLKWRWENEWTEPLGKKGYRVSLTGRRQPPPPHNLTIVKGSAYGIFSRKFVNYLINDKVAQDYLEWCRTTYSPDEHYWNTLHHTYYNPHISPPGSYSGSYYIFLCISKLTEFNVIIIR